MKKIMTTVSASLAALLILFVFASCGFGQTSERTQTGESAEKTAKESVQVDETGATVIAWNGSGAHISGAGAAVNGTDVLIQSGGTFTVRGETTDGRIVVDAGDADVTLVLDGAQITSRSSSAIYVYSAKQATVFAKEGTQNTLTDGESYTYTDSYASEADEEPNACLYSKADLILAGSGALTVNGRMNNGITGNDTLGLADLTLTVNAANNGVTGKDSLTVRNADVTVTAGSDGLRATNDKDETLGTVTAENAKLTVTAGEDGVQAQTALSLADTTASVTTGGGSSAQIGENDSAKGLKAGTDVTISGGSCTLDCADDAVHADGNVAIRGGKLHAQSSDDAIHAEDKVTVDDGEIDVTAHEGIEGTRITINAGKISIRASDDGINAGQKTSGVTPTVEINGGELEIEMGQGDTDAVDANGDIIINGGTIRITAQSAFDYDGKGELNGGEVYVNGEKITELTNQFGGGIRGGMGGMRGGFSGEMPQGAPGERPERPTGENMPEGEFPFGRGNRERAADAPAAQNDAQTAA
ncbi:MAG: carbohydrate-binding domain-containing protein [Clostridia bacterium]|nr:carbohydrate-binding domain-containing protein [Clostridia bacterium]